MARFFLNNEFLGSQNDRFEKNRNIEDRLIIFGRNNWGFVPVK